MRLSILCVTRAEPRVLPCIQAIEMLADVCDAECVLVADGTAARIRLLDFGHVERESKRLRILQMDSRGYLESVHDAAVGRCLGEYVLRLDDDETPSGEMVDWIQAEGYTTQLHWRFKRKHLWEDQMHFLANERLWPDYQTRLSVKKMATGRTEVHAASPYGKGFLAPGAIHHHKFLLRTREERQAMANKYEALKPGGGLGKFLPFNLPEVAYGDDLDVRAINDITVGA
jgi:hypothetical protein